MNGKRKNWIQFINVDRVESLIGVYNSVVIKFFFFFLFIIFFLYAQKMTFLISIRWIVCTFVIAVALRCLRETDENVLWTISVNAGCVVIEICIMYEYHQLKFAWISTMNKKCDSRKRIIHFKGHLKWWKALWTES